MSTFDNNLSLGCWPTVWCVDGAKLAESAVTTNFAYDDACATNFFVVEGTGKKSKLFGRFKL